MDGATVVRQRNRVDVFNERTAAERRKGESQYRFREPVYRYECAAIESIFCESGGKALERRRANRLGAIEGEAPRSEIEADQILVVYFGRRDLVSEIGSG